MISSIVITYNEELNIGDCLESLKWTDEIIVVDSNSSDKTEEIARGYTEKIHKTDNLSFGEKKNFGIDNAKGDWILWIDADERVTPELQEEIQKTINGNTDVEFFEINRKSFFISKFIRHCGWYPDYTLRLFKKTAGVRFDSSRVHEKAVYSGKASRLHGEILHYTDRTFENYSAKMNNYTTLSTIELSSKGKTASIIDMIFRPVFTFFKMYFLKLGILDGYMGLVLCTLSSVHVFLKYSKLYYLTKGA